MLADFIFEPVIQLCIQPKIVSVFSALPLSLFTSYCNRMFRYSYVYQPKSTHSYVLLESEERECILY